MLDFSLGFAESCQQIFNRILSKSSAFKALLKELHLLQNLGIDLILHGLQLLLLIKNNVFLLLQNFKIGQSFLFLLVQIWN